MICVTTVHSNNRWTQEKASKPKPSFSPDPLEGLRTDEELYQVRTYEMTAEPDKLTGKTKVREQMSKHPKCKASSIE